MAWSPEGEKISKLSLFVLAQLTNVTDGQTDTGWHQRPRLCIVSRGKHVYIAYNFSHFAIYLPKPIKIRGNLTKFWQKQKCTVFIETRCILSEVVILHATEI